jgi:hypothetical protein
VVSSAAPRSRCRCACDSEAVIVGSGRGALSSERKPRPSFYARFRFCGDNPAASVRCRIASNGRSRWAIAIRPTGKPFPRTRCRRYRSRHRAAPFTMARKIAGHFVSSSSPAGSPSGNPRKGRTSLGVDRRTHRREAFRLFPPISSSMAFKNVAILPSGKHAFYRSERYFGRRLANRGAQAFPCPPL